jgi:hypothetical protein
MSFSSQFSLSLELTRLLPVAGTAVSAAATALMNLARELQSSGSDIVVEEDVAQVFGRNVIKPEFETLFRQKITDGGGVSPLSDLLPIVLQRGPGPTVRRALRQPIYMSMVVQLSLLTATHNIDSLASGLSEALRMRTSDPYTDTELPYVTSPALKGLLQACQDQTSGFQWPTLLNQIHKALGLENFVPYTEGRHTISFESRNASNEYQALPISILQALLDMLTAVQRFYQDSIVVIDGCRGVVTIVAWAHFVLGLTVCNFSFPLIHLNISVFFHGIL